MHRHVTEERRLSLQDNSGYFQNLVAVRTGYIKDQKYLLIYYI